MTSLDFETVAAQLESFIRRQFAVADDDEFFSREVNLAEEGYVDSVGLIEAVAFLEDTFGMTIPEESLFALESFHIDGLARLVTETGTVALTKGPRFERDPDLGPVTELIRNTWARPCWDYTEGLLDAYLRRPGGDATLSVALEQDGDLAAYQAAVPYRVSYGGVEHRVVQGAFWTGNPRFAGQGAGPAVLREVLRLSREAGFAGFCAVMEKDGQAARVLEASEGSRADVSPRRRTASW